MKDANRKCDRCQSAMASSECQDGRGRLWLCLQCVAAWWDEVRARLAA